MDLDGDCDLDVAVISIQEYAALYVNGGGPGPDALPKDPVFWLEQQDDGSFVKHSLDGLPITAGFAIEVLDVDGDDIPDIVAAPFDFGFGEAEPDAEHVVWWRGVWE